MKIESVIDKWGPSRDPKTKEQVVRNLLFLFAYGMENDLPIPYDNFFHPELEWELLLDFPDTAGEESLLFYYKVDKKILAGIQYLTITRCIFDFPELLRYLNIERLTNGKRENKELVQMLEV